ncbi:hypothetical protein SO802_034498 [Lithocarpus litseifolius]|uniref:RNase H type-1 domain-containing protein n=1 Tax=Lithocarpus litseifolius TaxID=425828 RepID=A0AAW2BHS5_9ROSI
MGLHGLAGCGGVVRNDNGQWVAGFSKRIGVTSSFAAELWGLRNLSYVNNIISPILDDWRQLITWFHQVRIKHCFRQANQCADGLARMSFRMNADFLFYDSPPVYILDVFEGDLNGMYSYGICPEPCLVA